ncbi:MAG: TrbI/VirB10 family protein [Caulobacter sp.]|nr:TrbI/VirB10 family protein [Caulobacter sp.]
MTRNMPGDPRTEFSAEDLSLASAEAEPSVGAAGRGSSTALVVAGFILVGVIMFAVLNSRRVEANEQRLTLRGGPAPSAMAEAPPPILPAVSQGVPEGQIIPITTAPVPIYSPMVTGPGSGNPPSFSIVTTRPSIDMAARLRAPTMIVDMGQAGAGPEGSVQLAQLQAPDGLPPPLGAAGVAVGVPGAPAAAGRPQINGDEQFARRVGDETPERASATSMGALYALVPQGTVIPGVLETAINSDLPGYTRAVVSRDVLSFDGKYVMIPRGSRIIGQYKSAVAKGQSRAFVIWTRVIRPDGVSIQIGSPGGDALGRGGLDGKVDRHFFQRYGGAILLSALNASVSSLGETPATQVTIGSPGAALGAASSALQGEDIAPTIKVRQGEAIRIFVARDLDFSAVGPSR